MIFHELELPGVFKIEIEPLGDERGFFARSFCRREFEQLGLDTGVVQCSVSFNREKGTLRGVHYQADPHAETKIVRCTRGAIYDVVVDLRAGSKTFCKWVALRLTQDNHTMMYVPKGCAHGFLTLQPDTEIFYQMSEFYHPELSQGVRWNDPAFGIAWPEEVRVISDRDRNYPDFEGRRA